MQRWFKMPVGTLQNPVIRLICERHNYDMGLVIKIYLAACELNSEENKKFRNDEEFFELVRIFSGEGQHVVDTVLRGLIERNVPLGVETTSGAERQRRFKERRRSENHAVTNSVTSNVTSNAESNGGGNALEREKERKKEPPLTPPQAGGDEGEDEGFSDFWEARPKLGHPDSRPKARLEYQRLVTGGMKPGDLLEAMRGYAAWAEGKKSKGKEFFYSTEKILRDGLYADYLPIHRDADNLVGMDLPEWQHPLLQLLSPQQVRSWFQGSEIHGNVIFFKKKFAFDWVKNNYAQTIKQVFGEKTEVRYAEKGHA